MVLREHRYSSQPRRRSAPAPSTNLGVRGAGWDRASGWRRHAMAASGPVARVGFVRRGAVHGARRTEACVEPFVSVRRVVQVRLDRGLRAPQSTDDLREWQALLIAIVARERSRRTTLLNTINAIHRRGKYRTSPIIPAGDRDVEASVTRNRPVSLCFWNEHARLTRRGRRQGRHDRSSSKPPICVSQFPASMGRARLLHPRRSDRVAAPPASVPLVFQSSNARPRSCGGGFSECGALGDARTRGCGTELGRCCDWEKPVAGRVWRWG